jgi:hypothetical protein
MPNTPNIPQLTNINSALCSPIGESCSTWISSAQGGSRPPVSHVTARDHSSGDEKLPIPIEPRPRLGRYPVAVMVVGAMIAREPAFELRVAILAPHRIDLLHVGGVDGELDL